MELTAKEAVDKMFDPATLRALREMTRQNQRLLEQATSGVNPYRDLLIQSATEHAEKFKARIADQKATQVTVEGFVKKTKASKKAKQELEEAIKGREWEAFRLGATWAIKYVVRAVKYKDRHFNEVDKLIGRRNRPMKPTEAIRTIAKKHDFDFDSFKVTYYTRHAKKKSGKRSYQVGK